MSDHIDQPPERSIKTAAELAQDGTCCGNCAYFTYLESGRCTLMDKYVYIYNTCGRWTEMK